MKSALLLLPHCELESSTMCLLKTIVTGLGWPYSLHVELANMLLAFVLI